MALLGDLIVRSRNQANDPCQVIGTPTAPTVSSSASAGIFSGATFFIITYLTQWGESTGSTEATATITAGKAAVLSGLVTPYAAVSLRAYWGTASGSEFQYIQVNNITSATTSVTVGLTADTVLSGVPPYKSSAYLPDTDGDIVSAYEMYRWLNDGLKRLGRLAGGILDQTGVAMPAGNAEVVIPGWWLSIKYVWHNGWVTLAEQQAYTWLQAPVTGIPGISTLWRNGAQQVMGAWPQPSTAPAITQLTAPMGATDNLAVVANTGDFHGTDGIILIGSPTILTSANGGFTSSFLGLNIAVVGAGPGATTLNTTVSAVQNQNQLTLTVAASTGVAGAVFDITGSGAPSFTAPGLMQIDSEVMSYSNTNAASLTGIIRGYAGTIATSHATNATVSQLIFRLLGRRMPVPVSVGQSGNNLDVPQGWDEVMSTYLLAQFKSTEQNTQEAALLLQEFEKSAIALRDDQIPVEVRQIGGLWPIGGAASSLAEIMDTVIVE